MEYLASEGFDPKTLAEIGPKSGSIPGVHVPGEGANRALQPPAFPPCRVLRGCVQEAVSQTQEKRALEFFQAFPTLDDALDDLPQVRSLLGEEKAALLEEAGRWGEDVYLETLRLEIRLTIQFLFAHRAAIKVEQLEASVPSASVDPIASEPRIAGLLRADNVGKESPIALPSPPSPGSFAKGSTSR